jgi:hypothetical protein
MKSKLVGLGLGLAALSTLGVVAVPAVAYADATTGNTTCYTGCSAPTTGVVTPQTVVTVPTEPTPAAASGGLAFTGADIEGMAAIGAGALVVGGALVRRSRRQRQVQANA